MKTADMDPGHLLEMEWNNQNLFALHYCQILASNLWHGDFTQLSNRTSCQYATYNRAIRPQDVAVAPDQKSLFVALPAYGIVRIWLTHPGCESCGNHLSYFLDPVVTRNDGLLGHHYVPNMNPVALTAETLFGRYLFFADGSLGTIMWLEFDDTLNSIRPTRLLHYPHTYLNSPRSQSLSRALGKLAVVDYAQRTISIIERHGSNYSMTLTPIYVTESGPYDLDAAVGGSLLVWSEPDEGRVMQALWDEVDGEPSFKDVSVLHSDPIVGLAYSEYYGRVYTTLPSKGSIMSISPTGGTATLHFSGNSSSDIILAALKPFNIIVDENTGAAYFTSMASPNLTAPDNCFVRQTSDCPAILRPSRQDLGEPATTAGTIWLLPRNSFSSGLSRDPIPFYTNPENIVIHITRSAEYLVFVEIPATTQRPLMGRVCTLAFATSNEDDMLTSDENARVRIRGPKDAKVILDWTSAVPAAVFAPIGATNLWDPIATSTKSVSMALLLGWIGFAILMVNMTCALLYTSCRKGGGRSRRHPGRSHSFDF
eukprot:Blabericola_migrator_1__3866@NODE_2166_length_3176_cov_31_717594_g1367_i0_p1_GENE_NODE_2166_length_3176_cov_31_717594_g1367_i0NODE_2166_length_3176_cov_31_717594_g1367_i0_p1_ORF_typecomplete_len539_score83_86SGL/PF08450_12/0_49SGL/PF08450_12/1_3Lactonase/PF10282_9/2_5Lactonase/PF10282_9/6_2_NODE_2166_length_3176_cov_31_717594_g1367_i03181934